MKKLSLFVCIFTAAAIQLAQAQNYYYELVERDQPGYLEYDEGYARVSKENLNNMAKSKRKVLNMNLHPYLGLAGSLGRAEFSKIKDSDDDDDFKSVFNKETMGLGGFAGLQFNQYVGLELFYQWGSTLKDKEHVERTDFARATIGSSATFEAYGVDLLGYLPVHRNIDIIFGLGYGWYDFEGKFDMSLYNSSVYYHLEKTFKDDLGKRAVRYSAGMQYLLNDNWSVRFMARYVDFTRSDIIKGMTELSLGVRYMF